MPEHVMTICLLAHAGATWFMVGLIWFVQVVHYPLMKVADGGAFAGYALAHQRRTGWVVGPVMLVEACSAAVLWVYVAGVLGWLGLGLLVLVWVSTFAVQVPMHRGLLGGFDNVHWRRLVASNWVRTWAWSARGVIAMLMLRVH